MSKRNNEEDMVCDGRSELRDASWTFDLNKKEDSQVEDYVPPRVQATLEMIRSLQRYNS